MLDLEVIPERSLGCPEKAWEFILGNIFSLFFVCEKFNFRFFAMHRNAFFSGCLDHPEPGGHHQECASSVQ